MNHILPIHSATEAKIAKSQLQAATKMFNPKASTNIFTCSSIDSTGFNEIGTAIELYFKRYFESNEHIDRRARNNAQWVKSECIALFKRLFESKYSTTFLENLAAKEGFSAYREAQKIFKDLTN